MEESVPLAIFSIWFIVWITACRDEMWVLGECFTDWWISPQAWLVKRHPEGLNRTDDGINESPASSSPTLRTYDTVLWYGICSNDGYFPDLTAADWINKRTQFHYLLFSKTFHFFLNFQRKERKK